MHIFIAQVPEVCQSAYFLTSFFIYTQMDVRMCVYIYTYNAYIHIHTHSHIVGVVVVEVGEPGILPLAANIQVLQVLHSLRMLTVHA